MTLQQPAPSKKNSSDELVPNSVTNNIGSPSTILKGDGANITNIPAAGSTSAVTTTVRKGSAGTINAGSPVYISGYNLGLLRTEVEAADASDPTKMPAIGVSSTSITNIADGTIVTAGNISGLDTSSFAVNDSLYANAGTLVNVKPIGSNLIQAIARVLRSNASNGVINIIGAGRSNDVPNQQDKLGLNEIATPTIVTDKGAVYCKTNGNLYYQRSDTGAEEQVVSGAGGDPWTLIETLTYAAETTKTTAGTLPVYAKYKAEVDIKASLTSGGLYFQFNGDTAANYKWVAITGAAVSSNAADNGIQLGWITDDMGIFGESLIRGKTQADTNGHANVAHNLSGSTPIQVTGIMGSWEGGNAVQLTSITAYGTQNLVGTIKIYGSN